MPKKRGHAPTTLTAIVSLLLLTASSAHAARDLHPARAHAGRDAHRRLGAGRAEKRRAAANRGAHVGADSQPAAVLLGDRALEPQYDTLAAGRAEAFRFRALSSGLADTAHVYVGRSNAAGTVFAGLYADANGHPGALLSAGSVTSSTPGGWSAAPIAQINLAAGGVYWLAVLGRGGSLRYRDRWHGSCSSETSPQATLAALPAAWKTGTARQNCPLSAYVTAEAPVPPAAPTGPLTPTGPAPTTSPEPPPSPLEPIAPAPPLTVEQPPIEPPPVEPPPAELPPVNTALPTIIGSATQGQVLSAEPGSWSGAPTSYTYQWQDCNSSGGACTNLAGETSSAHVLVSGDVGHSVRVLVSAGNAGGSATADSAPTAVIVPPPPPPPPTNTAVPSLSGLIIEGETLKVSNGTWTGSPSAFAYQWQDCDALGLNCANVNGAASTSYRLTAGDVGDTVRVTVTASNVGGSTSASSAPTSTVLALPAAPLNVLSPVVSGTAVEGETLSATRGTWTGSPTSYAYQWQDCNSVGASCANIAGATTSTRVLAASDVGHTTRVVVSASNAAGSTEAPSSESAQVVSGPSGSSGGAPEPTCTVETESIATAKTDLAINGEVVCLRETASPYASIAISSGPSTTNSTLVSAPGAHVVVKGVTVAASHITVEGLHIEGGINVGTGNSTAYSHDVIAWNDISNPSGDGVGVFARVEGPVSEFVDIEHNKIHNTSVTTEGDAVHAQGWANLKVRENDIYAISEEACKGACHDDIFQTYNAGFRTAHDFVFEKNYVHDNDTEGILLKDGDTATNATIRNNLMIRDERWGGIAGVWVDDCTHGLVIERNTLTEGNNIQPLSGSCVEPSVAVKQNVLGRMKLGGESASGIYALTSERNLFGESPAGLYKTGVGDETKSLSGSATYKCSPGCKVGNDDYRLATNPKEAGIDWNPGEQSWGPNH